MSPGAFMSSLRKKLCSSRAQALVELALALPLLLVLSLGAIEVSNMINSYLVLTHLTREAANLVSRKPGIKGSMSWATEINDALDTVISNAAPVIKTTGTGPNQWTFIYSMIEWNAATSCGFLSDGVTPDQYRVRRSNSGWAGSVDWEDGLLLQSSKIGADGVCASASSDTEWNESIKGLTTIGLTLHIVEVFYDYAPSQLTPAQNFIGALVPGIFYRRTVFTDITGF